MTSWTDLRAALSDLRGLRVHVVSQDREAEIEHALRDAGFVIHEIDGQRVVDEPSFFAEIARGLGLPAAFGHNWDAFIDVMGDVRVPEGRLALLWWDADRSLEAAGLQLLLDAVVILERAALDAAGEAPPLQLEVFLMGAGPAFER